MIGQSSDFCDVTRTCVVNKKESSTSLHPPPSTPASPCQRGAGSARMAPVGRELVGGASPLLSDDKCDGNDDCNDDGAASGEEGDGGDGGAYPER